MVDKYSLYGVIVRSIATPLLIFVLYMQVIQFRNRERLIWLEWLLLITVSFGFLGNVTSMVVNLFRSEDGNLIELARHISTVINSTAALGIAISFTAIYILGDKDE